MLGFGFLYRKAQATVDNAIAQLVWGLLMVVPLLVALGFTTAAGSNYLHRHYEPEIANLILAGVFFAISAVIAIGYAVRKPETATTGPDNRPRRRRFASPAPSPAPSS